ncbi:hypothetical protein CGUA_12340 [Corynebacterium guangdongense]|uniref:Uncharacterized protein n=1 Tax=Corynebacterium guangdongense TaxID=1783348 RepID=A0ABU2A025_9CORY|nr:hypothetical protein [Corynebacterium guangdongense]WJZ19003.1 hypothetical protein CGUA_12340 [Corynebacterium guangdongense]
MHANPLEGGNMLSSVIDISFEILNYLIMVFNGLFHMAG